MNTKKVAGLAALALILGGGLAKATTTPPTSGSSSPPSSGSKPPTSGPGVASANPSVTDLIIGSQASGAISKSSADSQLYAVANQTGAKQRETEYRYAYMDIQAGARNALNAAGYYTQDLALSELKKHYAYGSSQVQSVIATLKALHDATVAPYQYLLDKLNKAYPDVSQDVRTLTVNA